MYFCLYRSLFTTFLLSLLATNSHAELPLTIEDLITDKGKFKLDISASYANHNHQGIATDDPIAIQTGETSFVLVPTSLGDSRATTDTLVATVGLRYGLTSRTEIYNRSTWLHRWQRQSSLSEQQVENDGRFVDTWLGINHQFSRDDKTPALLGFVEIAIAERRGDQNETLSAFMLGLTTYRAIDPVVLSLTVGWRINNQHETDTATHKPGNMALINPSVAFAVNDRVTLTTGAQWTHHQPDSIDNQSQGIRRINTDLLMGVGYAVSKGNSLNLTLKANATGSDGADLRLNWLHTF